MSSHPSAPLSTSMPTEADIYSVAFEGFSEFERAALAACFRLTTRRVPAYRLIDETGMSDFLVADADHAGTGEAVAHAQRVPDTVFIGAHAPQGAVAWLPRPIDPVQIVRELDALVALRLALPENERENEREGGAVDAPAPPSPVAPRKAPEAAAAPVAGAGEVLVVEDSAIARKFLERRLQRLGYRVQTAASAAAARALLAQRYFDIVFLDVVLGVPGTADGLQLCQAVRQREVAGKAPRCAVVMVTGLSGATDRVRGTLAGCDAYLAKPLGEAEFIAALRRIDPAFDARCAAAM